MSVNFQQIQEASERIRPIAHRTPTLTCRSFDTEAGTMSVFKCENFQRGGAFKIRGATNFIYSLSAEEQKRGVVSYSSGNHAQAVAIAAESVGARATLVMPEDAPQSKMEATRAHGANIVTYDRLAGSREAIGRKISAETGAVLVPPYDHEWIIAGQGTTAMELLEDEPELDALAICTGGGGLMAGCSIAAKSMNPAIRIFGIEPEIANDTYLSFNAGRRIEIPTPSTIADGLRSASPGELTFPVIQRNVEQVILVTEREITETVKFLLSRLKILAEPSGAVAAAAVLHGKLPADVRRIGIVISGGNVDFDTLASF